MPDQVRAPITPLLNAEEQLSAADRLLHLAEGYSSSNRNGARLRWAAEQMRQDAYRIIDTAGFEPEGGK